MINNPTFQCLLLSSQTNSPVLHFRGLTGSRLWPCSPSRVIRGPLCGPQAMAGVPLPLHLHCNPGCPAGHTSTVSPLLQLFTHVSASSYLINDPRLSLHSLKLSKAKTWGWETRYNVDRKNKREYLLLWFTESTSYTPTHWHHHPHNPPPLTISLWLDQRGRLWPIPPDLPQVFRRAVPRVSFLEVQAFISGGWTQQSLLPA